MNTNFKVIGLTRYGIKPEPTALEADDLTTRPFVDRKFVETRSAVETSKFFYSGFFLKILPSFLRFNKIATSLMKRGCDCQGLFDLFIFEITTTMDFFFSYSISHT